MPVPPVVMTQSMAGIGDPAAEQGLDRIGLVADDLARDAAVAGGLDPVLQGLAGAVGGQVPRVRDGQDGDVDGDEGQAFIDGHGKVSRVFA